MALIDSLVAYWSLNNTLADSHSNSYTLTDNSSVSLTGTGLVYANVADPEIDTQNWLSRADNANLSGGAGKSFTIAAWVNVESIPGNLGILGKGVGPSTGFEYILQYNNGISRFRWKVCSATAEANNTSVDQGGGAGGGSAPSTATWYLVIVDHDATADTIGIATSVDGISTRYTTAYTFDVWDSGGDFNIGRSSAYFSEYFDGRIGPVMFWTRTLDSSERTALYNGGAGLSYAAMAGGGGASVPPPIPPMFGRGTRYSRRRRAA
jgi:hypothetical protein